MAAHLFNREWFSPKAEDGNLLLATRELRIKEAINGLNPGDWIQFEDGTKCETADEIKKAL